MRQIRITTRNLDYPQDNDCILPEGDPAHEIKKSNVLGGLNSSPKISEKMKELIKKYWSKEDETV